MIINLFFILAGLVALYYGGDLLVSGSIRVAKAIKMSPFVIGATVIGFGTSAPELAVSVLAAFRGSPELAMGNVIGSNIANVGLVLGITAMIAPLVMLPGRLKAEAPPLLIATFLILVLTWNLQLTRWNGMVLLCLLALFLWRNLTNKEEQEFEAEREHEIEEEMQIFANAGLPVQFLLIVAGLVLLILGAEGLVRGGVAIARSLGISEWFIGISIVAVGTSLPEIVSSVIAARRGHGEMAIGNVFGSNIFNILMVLGTASAIHPLNIREPIHPDLLFTTGLTCLLLVLIKLEDKLVKRDGVILLACYVAYILLKGFKVF